MKTFLDLLRHSFLAIIFHVAPRFANVLIFILIGRIAGPAQAGVFTLATTYLLIITTIMRGLDDLLIRQVSREPDRAANYLGNFLLLRLLLSATVYVGLVTIMQLGLNYPATTTIPIMILALSVVPDSLAFVAQSVLLGHHRFGPPAAIHSVTNLIKLGVGTVVLLIGGGLVAIAWVWFVSSLLNLFLMLVVAFKQVGGPRRVNWLEFAPLRTHWLAAMSFTAITVLTAIDSQADTVLLSIFRTEAEVGWYGAATTITFSLIMLSQAYRFAAYPQMTRYAQSAPDKLVLLVQKSIHYMAALAMPMVAGLILLATPIVNLVFGPKFAPTVPVLQVLSISLLFIFMGEPLNRLMLVKDRQRTLVVFLLISATMNVVLNIILIQRYGAVGAATARVFSIGTFFVMNIMFVSVAHISDIKITCVIRPAIATLFMVGILALFPSSLFGSILIGFITYGVVLLVAGGIFPDDIDMLRNYAVLKINASRRKDVA